MEDSRLENEGVREDGPLARDLVPPVPAHPRAGTRTVVATTAEYGRWRLSRVRLHLDDAIDEELDDYRLGLLFGSTRPSDPTTREALVYAEQQPDVTLWEGERCLAVIRPRPGGDPEVTRFDGAEDGRPLPLPSTDAERMVWSLVKEHGAALCQQAIVEKVSPAPAPRPASSALSPGALSVLTLAETMGFPEARQRLGLSGPYQVIWDAIGRLGTDAVEELRRIASQPREG